MTRRARMDDLGDRAVVVNMNPDRRGALSQSAAVSCPVSLPVAATPSS